MPYSAVKCTFELFDGIMEDVNFATTCSFSYMNKFLKLLTAVYNIVTRKIILDPINLKYSLKKYIKLALFTEMYIFYLAKSIFENFL